MHHIQPRILPVVEQHRQPTKYYLQSPSTENIREMSAAEAAEYGEPIRRDSHVVAGDDVAQEFFSEGPNETVRTGLPIPSSHKNRAIAEPILPTLGNSEAKRVNTDTRAQPTNFKANGGMINGDTGDSDSYTSSLSERSFNTPGMHPRPRVATGPKGYPRDQR
jgi:hypothetical protein